MSEGDRVQTPAGAGTVESIGAGLLWIRLDGGRLIPLAPDAVTPEGSA